MLPYIKNKIRFAWWGAEEEGLLGSTFYMNNLNATDQVELSNIRANLNFDMVGSPNFFRGVYNGTSHSAGSGAIQKLFEDYFNRHGIVSQPTAFNGRSDYGPFLTYGKAAGGLETGAEVIKSEGERILYGGLANTAFDPCYHAHCDSTQNIDQGVYADMGHAAGYALELLATMDDLDKFLQL